MAGQKASLQAKKERLYVGKPTREELGYYKLTKFTARMNQFRGIQVRFIEQFGGPHHRNGPKLGRLNIESFVTFLLNLASLRPRQRGLKTTYSLHVIGPFLHGNPYPSQATILNSLGRAVT